MIPAESALQTSFFPSQQFWDAFTSVEAPQMFPGGLHAPPLSQTCLPPALVSQAISYPLGLLSSGVPPQQDSTVSQKSPVIRQPAAMAHAFAPPPGPCRAACSSSRGRRTVSARGAAAGLIDAAAGRRPRDGRRAVVTSPEQQFGP
jgi:hypothetical protein